MLSRRNTRAAIQRFIGYRGVHRLANINELVRKSVMRQGQYYIMQGYSQVLTRLIEIFNKLPSKEIFFRCIKE